MARPKKQPTDAPQAVEPAVAAASPGEGGVMVRWTSLGAKRRAWAVGTMHAAGEEFPVSQRDAEILAERGFAERI